VVFVEWEIRAGGKYDDDDDVMSKGLPTWWWQGYGHLLTAKVQLIIKSQSIVWNSLEWKVLGIVWNIGRCVFAGNWHFCSLLISNDLFSTSALDKLHSTLIITTLTRRFGPRSFIWITPVLSVSCLIRQIRKSTLMSVHVQCSTSMNAAVPYVTLGMHLHRIYLVKNLFIPVLPLSSIRVYDQNKTARKI